jgi:hypothetical protein
MLGNLVGETAKTIDMEDEDRTPDTLRHHGRHHRVLTDMKSDADTETEHAPRELDLEVLIENMSLPPPTRVPNYPRDGLPPQHPTPTRSKP